MNKGDELNKEDTILKLSTVENIGLVLRWLWPMGVSMAILINYPSYEPSAGFVYLLGGGVIAFCLYKIVTGVEVMKSGKIYMKLTSDSVHYYDENNAYVIPWTNIKEFLVRNNEVRSSRGISRRESLYIITKDHKEKLRIDYYFGYNNFDLAILMSRKMRQVLNVPFSRELVRTEELQNGKPLRTIESDGWTPRPPII